jgi:hypothetical protein
MNEIEMDTYLHHANLEHFRKVLADTTDEVKRRTLLQLLAIEEARDKPRNTTP